MVFTSGVLIHISPTNVPEALREIYRASQKYIWGFEYWAKEPTEIPYRGHRNLLWKANYAQMYVDLFGDLELIKEEKLKYISNENIDSMFLLKKK